MDPEECAHTGTYTSTSEKRIQGTHGTPWSKMQVWNLDSRQSPSINTTGFFHSLVSFTLAPTFCLLRKCFRNKIRLRSRYIISPTSEQALAASMAPAALYPLMSSPTQEMWSTQGYTWVYPQGNTQESPPARSSVYHRVRQLYQWIRHPRLPKASTGHLSCSRHWASTQNSSRLCPREACMLMGETISWNNKKVNYGIC